MRNKESEEETRKGRKETMRSKRKINREKCKEVKQRWRAEIY